MADHATIFYNSKNVQFGEEAAASQKKYFCLAFVKKFL